VDILVSTSAFKFNMRRYTMVPRSIELYEFAQAGYLAQWDKPMGTC
jgi:hypothetical protein